MHSTKTESQTIKYILLKLTKLQNNVHNVSDENLNDRHVLSYWFIPRNFFYITIWICGFRVLELWIKFPLVKIQK